MSFSSPQMPEGKGEVLLVKQFHTFFSSGENNIELGVTGLKVSETLEAQICYGMEIL